MENENEVPAGFERHTRRNGLTDPWEPIYAASTGTTFSLGLHAGADIYSDDQPYATATAVFKVQTTSAKESGK